MEKKEIDAILKLSQSDFFLSLFWDKVESQFLQSAVLLQQCHGNGVGFSEVETELDPGGRIAQHISTILGAGGEG